MKSKIGLRSSMMLRILHQEFHISCYALVKRYGHKFAERSIYRHAKKPMDEAEAFDRRHNNKGRPRKLSLRDERCIVRSLNALRRERTEFTSGKIQEWAGINHAVGNRTEMPSQAWIQVQAVAEEGPSHCERSCHALEVCKTTNQQETEKLLDTRYLFLFGRCWFCSQNKPLR